MCELWLVCRRETEHTQGRRGRGGKGRGRRGAETRLAGGEWGRLGADGMEGMEGLVAEARAHSLDQPFGDDAARDAMIITQYQRLIHYALAGYGCLAAFAKRLDLGDDATALKECLDQTYDGDRTMTDLATGGINKEAAA